ncbi:S8 family serine peptidase [Ramlibacter sp. AN1133]|uniref:S8 family serine peptidase n=1 Tax=Ramlibacter sp. AN1133 TaxID=3133429 RepID=UPI0030C46E9B
MSIYSIRARAGMGPSVESRFDARVGRVAPSAQAEAAAQPQARAQASGFIEFDGEKPWEYLQALLAVMYGEPPGFGLLYRLFGASLHQVPLAWRQIREIRYLTTDPACGVALPMRDFMPPSDASVSQAGRRAALEAAIARLERLKNGALPRARRIALTVDFAMDTVAGELHSALSEPQQPKNIQRLLFGGTRPVGPVREFVAGMAGARRFHAQKLGLSGTLRPQLGQAMRLLHEPPLPEAGPLDYGVQETGLGTIIGIIDFGCDFAHPSFRTDPQGTGSRILALWDQNEGQGGRPPVVTVEGQDIQFGYGRMFTREDIEAALRDWQANAPADKEKPYQVLQYDPDLHHYTAKPPGAPGGPLGAHGTFVMEVAAGCRRSVGVAAGAPQPSGVASDADIVFVQVRNASGPGRRGLDWNDVLDAIAFVFHMADQTQRPCVVNLSLNTMSGPHDGDGFFDRTVSRLLRSGSAGPEARGRAVVIAAGNLPDNSVQTVRWQHLRDTVTAGSGMLFHWCMAAKDPTRNSVEIWYDATDAWLQATLTSPDGETLGPVGPGEVVDVMEGDQPCGCVVGSRLAPAEGATGATAPEETAAVPGRHVILLQLDAAVARPTHWQVRLELAPNAPAAARVSFDAWLERDDDGPSGLSRTNPPGQRVDPRDFPCTVGTLSCGEDAIVVGAYSTFANEPAPWGLSGRGPNRRGTIRKPDLSAPGHFVTLVRSRCGSEPSPLAYITGTSVAAPFVTGTIACIYQRDPSATLAKVRDALVTKARPLPRTAPGWQDDLGHGCLFPPDVLACFP